MLTRMAVRREIQRNSMFNKISVARRKVKECDWEPMKPVVSAGRYDIQSLSKVCKRIRSNPHKYRYKAFTGKLGIAWREEYGGGAWEEICKDEYVPLRNRVTTLQLGHFSGRTSGVSYSTPGTTCLHSFRR
jgi:hypothetical protein